MLRAQFLDALVNARQRGADTLGHGGELGFARAIAEKIDHEKRIAPIVEPG